jgi:hypothetical protein
MTKNYQIIIFLIILIIVFKIIKSNIIYQSNNLNLDSNPNSNPNQQNIKCKKSTLDNPMGNPLLYSSNDELNNTFCKSQDKLLDTNIKYNMYYNSADLFQKQNNTRSFITLPSQTYPNDINQYKKYLYSIDKPNCKIDGQNCMYNEDLRYHKNYYIGK